MYRGISKELRGVSGSRVSNKAKGGSKARPKSASLCSPVKKVTQSTGKKGNRDVKKGEAPAVKKDAKSKAGMKSRVSSNSSSKSLPKETKSVKPSVKKIVAGMAKPESSGKLRKRGKLMIGAGWPKLP